MGKSLISAIVIFALLFANAALSARTGPRTDKTENSRKTAAAGDNGSDETDGRFRKPVVRTSSAVEGKSGKSKLPYILGGLAAGGIIVALLLIKKEDPKPKTGTLQVNSTPTGARIWLDGSDTGKVTNTTLSDISPGIHRIKLVKEGYIDSEEQAPVSAGQTATVNINLSSHTISVTAPAADAIWVPGQEVEIRWTTGGSSAHRLGTAVDSRLRGTGAAAGRLEARRAAAREQTLSRRTDGQARAARSGTAADPVGDGELSALRGRTDGTSQSAGTRDAEPSSRGAEDGKLAAPADAAFPGPWMSETPVIPDEPRALGLTSVGIKLFREGAEILTIVSGTGNTGSFKWTVSADLEDAANYKVRVLCADAAEIFGESPEFRTARTGSLHIRSTPTGAGIFLNGSDTGRVTDSILTDIAPGTHAIKLVKEGHFDAEDRVSVEAGKTATAHLKLRPKREIVQGIEMVYIPPGEFMMGSPDNYPDERPVHKVRITRGFWIGKTEVTQGQWRSVMGSNPSGFQEGDDYPVERVSWNDTQAFIQNLSRLTGRSFRLPTEADWEYACRAGTTGEFYGNLDDIAWYYNNSDASSHPVGRKTPNAFGLYDMLGNVWEFVQDWYDEDYYGRSPVDDPPGPSTGIHRIVRSGSWANGPHSNRSARRKFYLPTVAYTFIGFRLVMTD